MPMDIQALFVPTNSTCVYHLQVWISSIPAIYQYLPALHIVSELCPLKPVDDYFAIGEKQLISDYECLLYVSTVP